MNRISRPGVSLFGSGHGAGPQNLAHLSQIVVMASMAIVAVSAGAMLYLALGVSLLEAILATLILLSGLLYWNQSKAAGLKKYDADLARRLAGLSSATADLAQRVGEMGVRLAACEQAIERSHAHQGDLKNEMAELEGIVQALADELANQDAVLQAYDVSPALPLVHAPQAPMPQAVRDDPITQDQGSDPEAFLAMEEIERAVRDNRIELYLQPIVTLPQRKVRWYEVSGRLRTSEGELWQPEDFIPLAREAGVMPLIDNFIVYRSVQLVRRLQVKNRDIGLMCDLAAPSLADPEFIPQFSEFLSANPELANILVFEIAQETWRNLGAIEQEALASLTRQGFRLSLDQVKDFRFDPRELSDHGVRFLKVPADMLLKPDAARADIHPADLTALLRRYTMELIVERIENEKTVVDVIDHDAQYGQGDLFSPPRPVRSEALRGITQPAAKTQEQLPATPPRPASAKTPAAKPAAPAPRRRDALATLAKAALRGGG